MTGSRVHDWIPRSIQPLELKLFFLLLCMTACNVSEESTPPNTPPSARPTTGPLDLFRNADPTGKLLSQYGIVRLADGSRVIAALDQAILHLADTLSTEQLEKIGLALQEYQAHVVGEDALIRSVLIEFAVDTPIGDLLQRLASVNGVNGAVPNLAVSPADNPSPTGNTDNRDYWHDKVHAIEAWKQVA